MSVVVVKIVAFFGRVWSFVLTLVRSLLALFRRSSNPLALPPPNTTPDALARAHSHLRPILLLTPRSITLARTRSATSTLLPPQSDAPPFAAAAPQRTSPKLDKRDAELALFVASLDLPAQPALSASTRQETPDTSRTGSSCVLPLTPPDRCYLAPLPSATDCPYTVAFDREKPRRRGSPLNVSTNVAFPNPVVAPIGSPPPGRWSPTQVWTSTPCRTDNPVVSGPALSPFDEGLSAALATISHALISRSESSAVPYDDASSTNTNTNTTSDEHHRFAQRSKNKSYPRFHHPDAYACMWRRQGARLPGKPVRAHGHTRARSRSHGDLDVWYNADAYIPSPITAFNPPLNDATTKSEEDVPLYLLKERLAHPSDPASVGLGLAVPMAAVPPAKSSHTRRMSEGCLLAIAASTPTRVGLGARSRKKALSTLDGGGNGGGQDWLDALSLRFSFEQRDAVPAVAAG